MGRLISCPRCGRIHRVGECPIPAAHSQKYGGGGTRENKFRSTNKWTEKSIHIRERDNYLCQACLHDLDGQGIRYTTDHLEVHHIVPIAEAWDSRLDDDNLITLCREHHEMAEQGRLDSEALRAIAEANAHTG